VGNIFGWQKMIVYRTGLMNVLPFCFLNGTYVFLAEWGRYLCWIEVFTTVLFLIFIFKFSGSVGWRKIALWATALIIGWVCVAVAMVYLNLTSWFEFVGI
jgi:hypothetical protein